MLAAVEGRQSKGGEGNKGDKGKQVILNFQNTKHSFLGSQHHNSRERIFGPFGKENAQIGAKFSSLINGIVSNGIKDGLVLDVSLRLDCGLDGKWGVQEVGLTQVGQDLNVKTETRGCQ